MLTYTFSRREKVLIALFTVLLLVVAWYRLVYVTTTNQIHVLENEIAEVNADISASQTKLAKKREMEKAIEQKIAEGVEPKPIPEFDNIKPLMAELDSIMANANSYTLSFDSLDKSSSEYVKRGVGMKFECNSYEEAETLVRAVADGTFPCIVDSVSLSNISKVSVSIEKVTAETVTTRVTTKIHVVFYERHPKGSH